MDTELADFDRPDPDFSSHELIDEGLSPSEVARRLGVSRSRIYALVEQGLLDALASSASRRGLSISSNSIERRLHSGAPVGQPLSSSSAWAVLSLASGDAAFRDHVAARLSDSDRSRARVRLVEHTLLELLPRLRSRHNLRRYATLSTVKHLWICSATRAWSREQRRQLRHHWHQQQRPVHG